MRIQVFTNSRDFTEVHRTSRDGWGGFKSSGSITDAWMGTFLADPAEDAACQVALQAGNAQFQDDGLRLQQQALQAGLKPPHILLFGIPDSLEGWTPRKGASTETDFH